MTQQRVMRRLAAGLGLLILAAIVNTILHPEPYVTGCDAVIVGGAVAVVMVLLLAFVGVPFALWASSLPDENERPAAPQIMILPPARPALSPPTVRLLTGATHARQSET